LTVHSRATASTTSADVRPIPVVICADVEPDARAIDRASPSPWRGFDATVRLLQPFRERVTAHTTPPMHVSWYLRMDPQVRIAYGSAAHVVEEHEGLVERLRSAGDHFGLHVHSYRWDEGANAWVIDYSSAAWIDECLGEGFAAFRASVGEPCRTFRFGDHWMDHRTFATLESLGVEVDLTIEPGHDAAAFYPPQETYSGLLPDYSAVPCRAYRPSADDYRVPDTTRASGPWELPVTTAPVQPGLLHRAYRTLVTGRPQTRVSTALLTIDTGMFARIIETVLSRPQPYLVLPIRTGAADVARYASRVQANLAGLLRRPEAQRFAWVDPVRAIQLLQPS
jgi:hypothetical protein